MLTQYETICTYTARDGTKFLDAEECIKYELENCPPCPRRYIATINASFVAVYDVEGRTKFEALEEARQAFEDDYKHIVNYGIKSIDLQCDDDNEED